MRKAAARPGHNQTLQRTGRASWSLAFESASAACVASFLLQGGGRGRRPPLEGGEPTPRCGGRKETGRPKGGWVPSARPSDLRGRRPIVRRPGSPPSRRRFPAPPPLSVTPRPPSAAPRPPSVAPRLPSAVSRPPSVAPRPPSVALSPGLTRTCRGSRSP
jgi:hypothetical protein